MLIWPDMRLLQTHDADVEPVLAALRRHEERYGAEATAELLEEWARRIREDAGEK